MVPRFSTLSSLPCESCQLGKHTRVSFPKRLNNRAKSPFELVHTDVWGPCRIASTLGFQYFVTFIDDYSRCTWLFLMKNRAKLFSIFQKFYAEIQTQKSKPSSIFLFVCYAVTMPGNIFQPHLLRLCLIMGFFMKGPSILKLTVISLERRSHQNVLLQVLLIQMIN